MTSGDLPEQGTANGEALSFDDGVDSIANLLGPAEPEPKENEASEKKEPEGDDVADTEEVDAAGDDDGERDETEDDDEGDDSPDAADPAMAKETAKVRMKDGRTITVAELREHADRRIADFQRDYTRKSTELSERAKTVENAAQVLAEQRDILVAMLSANQIQPPDPAMIAEDPIGYMQAKEAYGRQQRELHQLSELRRQDMARQQAETQQQQRERLAIESERLTSFVPELKDPAKRQAFARDAAAYAAAYDVTPEEIASIGDARQIAILRDAMAYRRLKDAAKTVPKALEGKPKVLSGQRRADPKSSAVREAEIRKANLRKTGTLDAGIASLMDLDL